jgi:hypothetical protein
VGDAVTINGAAAELRVDPRTIERWFRRGAPVVERGRRGRANKPTLVDVDALRRWRNDQPRAVDDPTVVLARALPDLIAAAVFDAFCAITNEPAKLRMAGPMADAWLRSTTSALDHLRTLNPDVPELDRAPVQIRHLRALANDTVSSSRTVKRK